jgi:hypothetical protein
MVVTFLGFKNCVDVFKTGESPLSFAAMCFAHSKARTTSEARSQNLLVGNATTIPSLPYALLIRCRGAFDRQGDVFLRFKFGGVNGLGIQVKRGCYFGVAQQSLNRKRARTGLPSFSIL